ncbi:MAG: FtsX-like permease family protein, partial [Bacteroidota bacterium]
MLDSLIIWQGEEHRIVGVMDAFKYNGEFESNENRLLTLFSPRNAHWVRMTQAYVRLDPAADITYEEKISEIVESVLKTSQFVIQDAPLLRTRSNLETWIPIVALLSICGFLCLNVALGLFGVLSYTIRKRKSEVGLRRALGADGFAITSQFTAEVIFLAVIAILIGSFFGVQVPLLNLMDIDGSIFYRALITSGIIILLVVLICALYPSMRASKIHPAIALHED